MSKQQPGPRTCASCRGEGGKTTKATDSDGVTRESWTRCTSCTGTGVAGGGR